MNRRNSLKAIVATPMAIGVLADACSPDVKEKTTAGNAADAGGFNRMAEEKEHEEAIKNAKKFFTTEEMATITLLADIIIPKDEVSGSASDAKVPDFIEFIVKDMPDNQTPMRGGLRWLDMQCLKKFGHAFTGCSQQQQMEMVDAIAYPAKAKPDMAQGVAFFNLMRDLTASGFYTSEIGVKDIGYMGNTPNEWNGVPDEVLKQYGLAYSERELKECMSPDKL